MIEAPHSTDRRAHERRAFHGTAALQGHGLRPVQVSIVDVSLGGMRVVAPFNPREGDLFGLSTRLPVRPSGSLAVELKVRVTHSILSGHEDGFTLGLVFLDLPAAAAQALRDYLGA